MASWRCFEVCSPRTDTVRRPAEASTRSAASMTSMCLAKKTTLPTECDSCTA